MRDLGVRNTHLSYAPKTNYNMYFHFNIYIYNINIDYAYEVNEYVKV